MNTKINYLYRDGANYKAHNEYIVLGEITKEQITRIIKTLTMGDSFIPEQIGLPINRPSEELTSDDHCYCELSAECFELTDEEAFEDITCEELVQRFEKAAKDGWDDITYGVFVEDDEDVVKRYGFY